MENKHGLRGFATINFWADDLTAAKSWYAELLGIEPYFELPGYASFALATTSMSWA
jgi:catechol 2,3-dioxygenase-like lactoylglutathione lyase family enzyme